MSTTPGTQPCPFCGELIKSTAVKCRFCGEFLDEEEDDRRAPAPKKKAKGPTSAKKWLLPVGRNIWALLAGYFGIAALAPLPIIIWGFAVMGDARTSTVEVLLYFVAGINGVLGLISLLMGTIALITLMGSEKSGMGRAIFGLIAGLVGGLGYLLFVHFYWIPTYVILR